MLVVEILSINSDATDRTVQVALLAAVVGLFNSFRMMRLPEVAPSASVEGATLG